MCCFWNHAECSFLLLSVMTARAQMSASVPFDPLKPQNKMHTNMSLPLIYNHWWTHLVLITKKQTEDVTCFTISTTEYYSTHKLSAELRTSLSWRICSSYIIILMCIDVTIGLKTFLYEFHVNKLNSMYYSNWFVMSCMLFLACFTKCFVKSDMGHFYKKCKHVVQKNRI